MLARLLHTIALNLTKEPELCRLSALRRLTYALFFLLFVTECLLVNLFKIILSPLYRLLYGSSLPVVVRTPEHRFHGLETLGYTFSSHYISIGTGSGATLPRVHYLDEGPRNAPVIMCLHGEPAWSFLYRNMIPGLVSAGYRVVAPDMIGFGQSDKFSSPSNYSHELHTMVVRQLVDRLQLADITLVCHGGPTGLSVVKDCPDRFSNLVILNSWLPVGQVTDHLEDPNGKKASRYDGLCRLLPFLAWRSLALACGSYLPVPCTTCHFLLPNICGCNRGVADGYNAPFASVLHKAGVAAWPLLAPVYADDPVASHMEEARSCLKKWKKPALIMFGDEDPVLGWAEKLFVNLLPHAKRVPVRGAGHFPQETHHYFLVENILKFLKCHVE